MARIPRAQFLNRTWASHEHQRLLRVGNQQRLVCDELTRQLRNPALHHRGLIRVAFSAADYPDLMAPDTLPRVLEAVAVVFGAQGYAVSTVSGGADFTVTLDWRDAGQTEGRRG